MQLNYKKLGKGEPVLILHGLYGSSDNWLNIGEKLAEKFTVYILDLRNHGWSPHSSSHSYPEMRDDVYEFMINQNIQQANIIGHSMGGKTAVYFALDYPEMVKRLIVVDIMPTPYEIKDDSSTQILSHKKILETLAGINIKNIDTLKEADEHLKKSIPYKKVRQFLLKNLKRDKNKNFFWLLNLPTLIKDLPRIMDGIKPEKLSEEDKIDSLPVLFIKGEHSDYIRDNAKPLIQKFFPKALLTTIKGAGHWVHAEKREEFITVVSNFLEH
jgi:pimeloyl-ACP methyl ester carboxylesterase